MEFINENNFDPTPKLKSSPVPILFLPFNNEKLRCNNCENKYSATNLYKQKYCKQCLSSYIENITDNNIYFNVNILTNNEHCIKHKSTRNLNFFTKNIQEWCENCSEISYFKNYYDYINTTTQYIFIEKDCKLCGKLIDKISFGFKMCSDCYLISSGWIKSTITGKNIPILYLPWWDTSNKSIFCKHNLKFMTDCQKWCSDCFIIYVGCRYCLTTNIIYGIIDQTQCIKCKRISNIKIEFKNISSGNHDIDEFLISTRTNTDCHDKIANYKNTMNKNSDPLSVYSFIERELKKVGSKRTMEWIPYSQIKNLEKIAEGGFGIIYKAIWLNKTTVAVKRFRKSQDISKYFLNFLNEVKSLHRCYDTVFIVKYYGITQDPVIKDYMLIMEYASGGNLHSYLNKNFINIKWITKLAILCQISDGIVDDWYRKCKKDDDILAKADNKRLELIESKQIGPEFTEKQDISAIYTSQPLSSLISQVSSNNSSSRVSKQVCTSEECKFDTDNSHNTQRSSSINSSSGYISKDLDMDIETNTQRLTTFESSSIKSSSEYISKDLDMDIETNTQRLSTIDISSMSHNISHPSAIYTSRPLSALISHVKNNRN
ncbi:uncharacterized protein OCT59_011567 [Rhizophagus irregularis]|uniref:uncharacterized protein n=1 Tax=Rhizophagus irregularis TaxID=588596 RepID=UPI00333286DF|nr:hypothetical protein OCT59_011567 [Rhizophagus irregularis]